MEFILDVRHISSNLVLQKKSIPSGPPASKLLQSNLITLVPPVLYDTPKWGRNFGDVIQQPSKVASPGDTVKAIFVSISFSDLSAIFIS